MNWFWKAALVFWGAFSYWSIVPIIIIMVIGAVTYKSIITPKEYQDRIAWEQKKENQKLSIPKINRIGTIFLKYILGFMSATFFCISIFKMLS